MFTVYYANQLEYQKQLLIHLLEVQPLSDPFASNIILVQSPGMAQWLQIQLADHFGIAANFSFPMPSSFIWSLYKESIPSVGEQNLFSKEALVWRLMRILPALLDLPAFNSLRDYLGDNFSQLKLFQLAEKIADLFDQYLVYRPDWINQWEAGETASLQQKIAEQIAARYQPILSSIMQDFAWQTILWQKLVADIQQSSESEVVWHRANLYQTYLQQLSQGYRPKHLPKRICVFGISALPPMFLTLLKALSDYTDIHLFFNTPSRYYWGDLLDHRYLEKLKIKQLKQTDSKQQIIKTIYDESLTVGHSLLASWGKLGRDFLYSLTQLEPQEVELYLAPEGNGLLQQLQREILELNYTDARSLHYQLGDNSLSFHACHSPMREVEVLHDNLLAMFAEDPHLTPKDIVVMVADIDRYTPYIQAVFSQYHQTDKRHIPFAISDRKITESDVVIATFLQLFTLKESLFSVENVLALLDVECIRQRFALELEELNTIREWVTQAGVRYGLTKHEQEATNYNAWQNGIERLLLGYALTNESGVWQDSVGFDYSNGLQAKITGKLANFIEALQAWYQQLQQELSLEQWREEIIGCIETFFTTSETGVVALLKQTVHQVLDTALQNGYQDLLDAEVISELLQTKLNEQENSVHFLMGQLNFCTLLPMRAIPFKVICLLGMNEGDFPRQLSSNSFDVMQYQPQKGDRVRREDDSYLFLEALLSAREKLYISYVGYSIIDNTAYEPSVLVGQLLDYLQHHLAQPDALDQLKFTYPATIFSANNFTAPHFSYSREWAAVAQAQRASKQLTPFITALTEQIEEERSVITIDLEKLIQFIIDPQRDFFEKRLGVYLNQQYDNLAESEQFVLDNLSQYRLKERLLQQESTQWEEVFAKAMREGILPRAGFAFLQQAELEQSCAALWQVIAEYRSSPATSLHIEHTFTVGQQEVILQGQIDSLYQQQFVDWRAGKIRAKEQIRVWIYHLLLSIEGIEQPTLYFGLDKGAVCSLTLTPLSAEVALEQLQIYIQDYLAAQQQICLVPTHDLVTLQKLFSGEPEQVDTLIDELNKVDQYNKKYPYWQRLLVQTPTLDYAAIKTQFARWFTLLLNCLDTK
ncbi:exodeoxyribonuclease V subunit gamma [Gallibacterium trehalosifermentans]|uniref:RecBCD enzyme subunit RecC n=1 Tax=Gallibacterium trehalosifermentans TaxID=516935 RepID=A0ABV6H056_9PAST